MITATPEIASQISPSCPDSSDRLFQLAYGELRQLAAARLRSERADHTLQATALVHEAYIRLLKGTDGADADIWKNRAHFFAAAAEAMRRILVESARRKRRHKRGGKKPRLAVDLASLSAPAPPFDVLEIADALTDLEAEYPDHAMLVKLRYFLGMTIAECANALGVATPTIERRWRYARAWLAQRLKQSG